MPWDPILKLILLDSVLVGLVNSAKPTEMKRKCATQGKKRNPNSHLMYCIVVCRGVHESGRVEFVPDPDSSRNFCVGENGTRNQLRMLVGSGGSGLVGFRVVPSGFELYHQ